MHKRLSERQLEELLHKLVNQPLPGEDGAPQLALRICRHIRQVRQRTLRLRMALSASLALVGVVLLAPAASLLAADGPAIAEKALPQNGLLVLWEAARAVLTEGLAPPLSQAGSYLTEGLQALLAYQGRLQPASAPAAPGLILLALSAILVMDLLFPREVFE